MSVTRVDGKVLVEVADDGVGGAEPAAGTGLRGLVDRVSALQGTLEVESRAGEGTTVRAAIPLRVGRPSDVRQSTADPAATCSTAATGPTPP